MGELTSSKHCVKVEGKDRFLDIQPFSELEKILRIPVRINLYHPTEAASH